MLVFSLNTTETHPKINWRRFLPSQGIATSVWSKPAASSKGLWARFWKRTWISWSVIVTAAVASTKSRNRWRDLAVS